MAELAHRRLCDLLWSQHRSPRNDDAALASMTRLSAGTWRTVKKELIAHGWRVRGGHFSHRWALTVLRAVTELRDARTASARNAALARWADAGRMPDASGAECAAHAINNKENKTAQVQRNKKAERSTLMAMEGGSPSSEENRFLAEVAAVFNAWRPKGASRELAEWGGWWRNRYRDNSTKARRVLGELASMVRERRITRAAGPAARDLWKRMP